MSRARRIAHQLRNAGIGAAAMRPFRPIMRPENAILFVRPDHFGDMLMLGPGMARARQMVSNDDLVLMAGPWNDGVARRSVPFDRFISFPFPGFVREASATSLFHPYRQVFEASKQVRTLAPRAAILLRDDHWWGALMLREAGVPLRFGYAGRGIDHLLSHPVQVPDALHYVEQNDYLIRTALAALGYSEREPGELALSWTLDEASCRDADVILNDHGVAGEFVVVHPGSGADVKLWPTSHWECVVDALTKKPGLSIVVTGSPSEGALTAPLAKERDGVVDLTGTTAFTQLAAVFARARLVIGVDSGPLHLAVAVGTPTIHLFGPSDPVRYGPWGDRERHRVVSSSMNCPSCGDLASDRPAGCGCMLAIDPEKVIEIARELIARG